MAPQLVVGNETDFNILGAGRPDFYRAQFANLDRNGAAGRLAGGILQITRGETQFTHHGVGQHQGGGAGIDHQRQGAGHAVGSDQGGIDLMMGAVFPRLDEGTLGGGFLGIGASGTDDADLVDHIRP